MMKCSLCESDFDIDGEGGVSGFMGIIPVAFCPTCRAGLWEMHEQQRLPVCCPNCNWSEDDEE
jgi:hypothetical protein